MIGLAPPLHEKSATTKTARSSTRRSANTASPASRTPPLGNSSVRQSPGEVGPFGARGIGEHPVVGVAPAVLNAIHDATGIEFTEIPVTPEKILAALAAKA